MPLSIDTSNFNYPIGGRIQFKTPEGKIFSIGNSAPQNKIILKLPSNQKLESLNPVFTPLEKATKEEEFNEYLGEIITEVVNAVFTLKPPSDSFYLCHTLISTGNQENINLTRVELIDFNGFSIFGNIVALNATEKHNVLGVTIAINNSEFPLALND